MMNVMRHLFFAMFLTQVLAMMSASAAPTKLQALRTTAKSMLLPSKNVGAWLSILPQKALKVSTAAVAAALIACGSLTMTGCEEGQALLRVVDTEYSDRSDELAGQYVTFYIEGDLYEGYWEITLDGLLLIEIDDGYGKIVLLEHMTGQAILNHPDIGAEVVIYDIRNGHEVDKYGEVVEVYDNGFYIIEINEIAYVHNNHSIFVNETVLANSAVLPEDGGFEFLDDELPPAVP